MRKVDGMGFDPVEAALAVVGMAREERFAEIERLFTPQLRAVVSAETLRAAWMSEMDQRGPVTAVGQAASEPRSHGLVRVSVPVSCENGGLTVVMSVDDAGRLGGLRLAPAATAEWAPPPYAKPRRFIEHEVTIGTGPLAVPGTLTLPRKRGRTPGVVLLSGGGPVDRDETNGPNKPLKDLAWGLASQGVAAVRFDKVTHTHGLADYTIWDEYGPHAIAAVRLLQQQSTVDEVFLLGHSAGGKVAPRVAAAENSVAGLVILAGDAQPMDEAAARVARHLGLAPDADLPFGLPPSYWLDLREYDQVATAARLGKPMLLLQGGRDYQVTVKDDLSRWQAGLAHRREVESRVYEADDHLFFPGEDPVAPADYLRPQHVDRAVVTDIARWLGR